MRASLALLSSTLARHALHLATAARALRAPLVALYLSPALATTRFLCAQAFQMENTAARTLRCWAATLPEASTAALSFAARL